MCGIAGYLNFSQKPAETETLEKMGESIAHRGPDGKGTYCSGSLGFAHRRLAIIDLSDNGIQPMSTLDGSHTIIFNGEVYNHREIRETLVKEGYIFKSTSDTEVILNAYHHWKERCLEHFNGMFAFAIWDKSNQELFIARDRYGIKPLYYTHTGTSFIFGSEIKAILAHGEYRTELDPEALLEYMTFQNFFTSKTLFKHVHLFPAGHFVKIKPDQTSFRPKSYWDYEFVEPSKTKTEMEYVEELNSLMVQAVNRQMISDVEVSSFLSGGLDSGTITALAARQRQNLKTFTVGFDLSSASGLELSYDEREKAERMSYLFKTEHYEMVLKSGDMERVFPKLTWHLEEPRIGQSYPNYFAAKLAGKFTKVVLNGCGGDEMFGGYPWRYFKSVKSKDFESYIDQYYLYWQRLVSNSHLKKLFKPIEGQVKHIETREIFKNVFSNYDVNLSSKEDMVNNSLYFEAKTFLSSLLVVDDKLSMAHGLEARVPFLDNDLVDFAMKLPVKYKIANLENLFRPDENSIGDKSRQYFRKTNDGKWLLRQTIQRYVPREVSEREKQGFSAPDASWFRGESIDYVKSLLFNDKARIYEYLDKTEIHALVEDHLTGRVNRRLFIWSLLSFENWLIKFLP